MFVAKVEKDKYGLNQTHFYLTQGDSCGIISTPRNEDGSLTPKSYISGCKFKLMDEEYNILFQKDLSEYSDGKYLLRLTEDETKGFEVGGYLYEIEYTLFDGGINTPNQWKWDITPQGV